MTEENSISTFRELDGHKVNGANDRITIRVLDEPGPGNACHEYRAEGPGWRQSISFQNGPIKAGINGTTHEVLLTILIDRLEGFQSGDYACEENATALGGLGWAVHLLKSRTEKRLARGVEGTHER